MKRKCSKKKEKTRLYLIAVLTAAAAVFSFGALYATGYMKYPGDVNVDRQIDVSDGVLLARYCVEDPEADITDEGMANADANGDREVDSADTVCVLQMIACIIPMPENPYAAIPLPGTDITETTAPPEETQPEETVTTAAPEQPPVSQTAYLTADQTQYPLGVSISVLTLTAQPAETLTVHYQYGNVVCSVFMQDPLHTYIAFAHNDDIFGYYVFCNQYEAPSGYLVTEYKDSQNHDALYAVLVQKEGLSISFPNLADPSDTQVLSKLAYYVTNGIRAVNGLYAFRWDEELSKAAMLHCRDMAVNDFCGHNSSDGTKFSKRLLDFGIDWQACAENVDFGYMDPFTAVNGWFNSDKGHRSNVLSDVYQKIGIAFAYGETSSHRYYGTQDFYKGWD